MTHYDPSSYRVIFFSSAPIGVPFLQNLMNDNRFEVIWVVTQPDKPAGRGMQMQENVIKTTATTLIEHSPDNFISTPSSINPDKSLEGKTFYDWLKDKNADFFVVISYGKILPQSILDLPKFGCINIHGSLLPKYRWPSPLQSVFLEKEKESWITIMKMDASMDTWDIIDNIKITIPFNWTVKELIEKFEKIWPNFLNNTLWDFGKWDIGTKKQDENNIILTKKIEKVDWFFVLSSDTLDDIYAKYRAFTLRPKISFIRQDKKIIIEKLIIDEWLFEIHKAEPLLTDWNLNLAVKDISLKPEWKKSIDWKSFVNGYLK